MEQYIPKAAVLAEIESLLDKGKYYEEYDCAYRDGNNSALNTLKNIIVSLDVKEVNFEDTKSVFDGQYLSKDKVVTTIERLQDECEEQGDNNGVELLEKLFDKIDNLDVKEVDLEKEIKEEYLNRRCYGGRDNMLVILNEPQFNEVAKHFFELGLRAQDRDNE